MSFVLTATPKKSDRGVLEAADFQTICAFGRGGLTNDKKEGDGATPIGRFGMRSCYWRPDRVARPVTGLPVLPIRRFDGWCDDPGHPLYNRPVRLPFPASHERMWREDAAYDLVVVLDQNLDRPEPGAGSAVFFHLTKSADPTPTEGCVAIAEPAMRRLLRLCDTKSVLEIRA
nr:L,D-transpeptidase family protein [Parvularcula oceani]